MLWQIFDKIRQMIMIKIDLRQRIAATKYVGHLITTTKTACSGISLEALMICLYKFVK
jgi:hypothetical protein